MAWVIDPIQENTGWNPAALAQVELPDLALAWEERELPRLREALGCLRGCLAEAFEGVMSASQSVTFLAPLNDFAEALEGHLAGEEATLLASLRTAPEADSASVARSCRAVRREHEVLLERYELWQESIAEALKALPAGLTCLRLTAAVEAFAQLLAETVWAEDAVLFRRWSALAAGPTVEVTTTTKNFL